MLIEQQLEVYNKLFQISENNMINSGNEVNISKEAFLAVVGEPALMTNIVKIWKLPKLAYLQALYALALRRLPDEGMVEICKIDTQSDNEYKREITESVRHSQEFREKQARIYNNVFSTHKNLPTVTTYFVEYPLLNKIYVMYRKIPQKYRRRVRKAFGRKE